MSIKMACGGSWICTFLVVSTLLVVRTHWTQFVRGTYATSDMILNMTLFSSEFWSLGDPASGNPIDLCWKGGNDWQNNRQALADCGLGFGKGAIGGKYGAIYVVTDSGDDDPVSPISGTLRHAVIQDQPLWIIFKEDMQIQLKEELIMNSFKTIDGRGTKVHISGGACITIQGISNIIIHGIYIHDCKSTGPAMVRSSPEHVGQRGKTDGDAINIFNSQQIWIDHCYLSSCADGLIDAIEGSTAITYSNNYFTNHDKALLLGAHDDDLVDKNMQGTLAFNYFGPGLVQRLPRGRNGYFHIANNFYSGWSLYAVGGSASPTINSEGNMYSASNDPSAKQVTKRIITEEESSDSSWNWRSVGDLFENGAYFVTSGAPADSPAYNLAKSFTPSPADSVPALTSRAGPLDLPH